MPRKTFVVTLLVLLTSAAHADAPQPSDYPVYVSKLPNPNDYSLFANGGWDGNWYVGYNTCWIKKLPFIQPGTYARAYLGAKLGRMKLLANSKNVWDKKPIPGAIYMAIASTSAWNRDHSFLLTTTEDIPLEGDDESAVEGTGESEWFWTEVPLDAINLNGENYAALWSPTPELLSVSSSPVLAAGWGGKDQDTWLTRDISGTPPKTPAASLGTPIAYFQPGIALKLIPQGPVHPIQVRVVGWKNATPPDHLKPTILARAEGDSIENVWLEYMGSNHTWTKIGRPLWKAPYIFSLDQTKLPPGRVQLRVSASNIWEESSASPPFSVDVSAANTKK